MADETQTEEDPSIEEILDSIRQIISEDDEEEVDSDPVPVDTDNEAADSIPEPQEESEPLDQSAIDDMDFDSPNVVPDPTPEAEAVTESEPLDQSAIDDIDFDIPSEPSEQEESDDPSAEQEEEIIELTDRVDTDQENDLEVDMVATEAEPKVEPIPEPKVEPIPEPKVDPIPEPEAVDTEPDTDDNLLTSGAESAAFAAISELARKTAVEYSGITLEEIVRSELKPMLRSWLDKNLPIVIERLVREELERVSKRVMED